jgi:transcriptional regulator GlxA family with amidase domain
VRARTWSSRWPRWPAGRGGSRRCAPAPTSSPPPACSTGGPRVALEVARWLVLFVKRPGGQAQFSAQLAGQAAERAPLRELQAWMADHLDADLSVPALAARAAMSDRHFARAFKAETGMTPAAYVEALRVERARLALEGGTLPIDAVARRCGFGTVETMRRAFARRLGVSPGAYRDRFAA